jgi:hypothetical protein
MKICAKFLKLLISEKSAQNALVNQEQSRFLISLFDRKTLSDCKNPSFARITVFEIYNFSAHFLAFFPTFQSGIERYYV